MSLIYLVTASSVILRVNGLKVPDQTCNIQEDCQQPPWTTPYPTCYNNTCLCSGGSCLMYTRDAPGYSFYCGSCGALGSECNETIVCDVQKCSADNFCHCHQGDVYRELCVIYEPIPTTITSVILIIVLVVLLIFLKLFKSRQRIKQFCCKRCSDTTSEQSTVIGFNPNSYQKSAAYTISNSDFMVTADDSELEWALELSRRMSQRGEEWLPMEAPMWSSPSIASTRTGSRNRLNIRSRILGPSPEPGPSGTQQTSRQRSTVYLSSSNSCSRQRIAQRSSTTSSVPSSVSSRNSSTTRRTIFSSVYSTNGSSHSSRTTSPCMPTFSSGSSSSSLNESNRRSNSSGSYDASVSSMDSSNLSSVTES